MRRPIDAVPVALLALVLGGFSLPAAGKSQSVMFQDLLNGGIVNNAPTALGIAEVIIANVYGARELDRQRPLKADDQEDRWVVRGSFNESRKEEGSGPARLVIRKRDAKVLDMELPTIMLVGPEVQAVVNKVMR